jgi:hypothetical protein
VRTIGSHIVFDLAILSWLNLRSSDKELAESLQKFESRNRAALAAVARPTGYMIAVPLPKQGLLPAGFSFCTDQMLTVAILGRIAGGIYIPNRQLCFTQATAKFRFAFPESAFIQQKGTQP